MTSTKQRRTILIHCHMFKNAGTTLDWALGRSLGAAFLDHRKDKDMRSGASYLGPFLASQPSLCAISSHHIQLPLPILQNAYLLPIVIFRHPIERVRSVYNFERQQNAETPGAIRAKALSFRDYVSWRMEANINPTIRNFQTRTCSERKANSPHAALTEAEFYAAKEFIEKTALLGLVERFEESMVLFEETCKSDFPTLDLSFTKQNAGKKDARSLSQRIAAIQLELGNDGYEQLLAENAYDVALYSLAQALVEKRISAIADFEDRRNNLRKRCAAVAGPIKKFISRST